jgi:hypothetical protein
VKYKKVLCKKKKSTLVHLCLSLLMKVRGRVQLEDVVDGCQHLVHSLHIPVCVCVVCVCGVCVCVCVCACVLTV